MTYAPSLPPKRRWIGLHLNNDHLNYEDHKEAGSGDHGIVQVFFKHDPA